MSWVIVIPLSMGAKKKRAKRRVKRERRVRERVKSERVNHDVHVCMYRIKNRHVISRKEEEKRYGTRHSPPYRANQANQRQPKRAKGVFMTSADLAGGSLPLP